MRYSSVSQRFENFFNSIIIVSFLSDIGGEKYHQTDWLKLCKKKKYAAIFINIYGHKFYGLSKPTKMDFRKIHEWSFLTTIHHFQII